MTFKEYLIQNNPNSDASKINALDDAKLKELNPNSYDAWSKAQPAADPKARFGELSAKRNAGTMTPEESKEFTGLLAAATKKPTLSPTSGPLSPEELKRGEESFYRIREQAANEESQRQMKAAADAASKKYPGYPRPTGPAPAGKTWVQGSNGNWQLIDTIKVNPESMQTNPDLIKDLNHAAGIDPDYAVVDLTKPQGVVKTPKAEAAVEKKPAEAPKVEAAPDLPAQEEAVEAPTPDLPAQEEAIAPQKSAEPKKKSFGEVVKDLNTKYGVPLLKILQAGAYGQAGLLGKVPTFQDKEDEEKYRDREREFMKQQEEYKAQREAASLKNQQDFQSAQAELDRASRSGEVDKQIAAQKEIARTERVYKLQQAQAAAQLAGNEFAPD